VRPQGQTKLGFFPLPIAEAKRLKNWLTFPERCSVLDPCVGDGVAFTHLFHGVSAHRYGIEIDANRAEQARALGIETMQANTTDVRCQAEVVSLLYLNPPYDWESGESNNQRLELVFLEHSYRCFRYFPAPYPILVQGPSGLEWQPKWSPRQRRHHRPC
jgi:Uncharacterised methyltransferase family (DUF6094)